jgi:hypothetical protein
MTLLDASPLAQAGTAQSSDALRKNFGPRQQGSIAYLDCPSGYKAKNMIDRVVTEPFVVCYEGKWKMFYSYASLPSSGPRSAPALPTTGKDLDSTYVVNGTNLEEGSYRKTYTEYVPFIENCVFLMIIGVQESGHLTHRWSPGLHRTKWRCAAHFQDRHD